MTTPLNKKQIAYRCPDCATVTVGFLGRMSADRGMLRLKCSCGESTLDITPKAEEKVHLSVPCVYCKESHGYNISRELLLRDKQTRLTCPFSGMDIAFIGSPDEISRASERTAGELANIMAALEADDVKDIQPTDCDESEGNFDPSVFDTINFLVKDLEADNRVECPCKRGKDYTLRFTDEGMQLSCPDCGASYLFYCMSASSAERYLSLDGIKLS